MLSKTVKQDAFFCVDPHSCVVHQGGCRQFKVTVFWIVFLNVSLVVFDSLKLALRQESSRMSYPRDLRAKVVLLLSEEEWVCVNWSLQISREHHFDFSSCQQILDAQVWQFGPLG